MKIHQSITVTLYFLLALYLGIGGFLQLDIEDQLDALEKQRSELEAIQKSYFINGLELNTYEYRVYQTTNDIPALYSWLTDLGILSVLLCTSFAFGMLGSCIYLLKKTVVDQQHPDHREWLLLPILGSLVGFLTLGASYALPSVLVKEASSIRPLSLMFLCLFSGIYTDAFFKKIGEIYNKD